MQLENGPVQIGPMKAWGAFFVVVVISFSCFIPGLYNELLQWDDGVYITGNSHIRNLNIDMISWAFSEFYQDYWAPLTWLSLATDYAFWGLNPAGYHLTNNILHALNAGLFFLISLELLTRHIAVARPNTQKTPGITNKNAVFCSLLAAIFFAVHPLRVESVAWATERKDVLSLFFGLLAVLAYLKHAAYLAIHQETSDQKPFFAVTPYYWLTIVFFCLSLLSKAMLVTLPPVLLVLDWFPLKRLGRHTVKSVLLEKAPLMLFAAFASAITIKAQAKGIFTFDEINMTTRLLNAFKSIMAYLRLTVWPLDLSPFYVHPMNIPKVSAEYALPIVFFVILSGWVIFERKRRPLFMAVWLIYLMTLFPVLGFTQVGPQAMAGRFTYLSGLPIAFLFAVGMTVSFHRLSRSRPAVVCLALAVTAILLVNGYLTIREISFWRDDVTIWTRVIEVQPHSVGRAYFQRSDIYASRGEFRNALNDVNEALAIAMKNKYRQMDEIYILRARILTALGALDDAIADYTNALATASTQDRSCIYIDRGKLYKRQGKTALADEDFRLSLKGMDTTQWDQNRH